MNLYRCDTEKSLEFQLGRSTAGTHRRGAPLSLQDYIFVIIIIGKVAGPLCWFLALISKSVFGLHPKNGVFENEIEETTKLSFFFLADNHNTSIDALIFDNCYYFISSL